MKDTLQLKHNFENIKKLRSDILNIFETTNSKIDILKKVYMDMIKPLNQNICLVLMLFIFKTNY